MSVYEGRDRHAAVRRTRRMVGVAALVLAVVCVLVIKYGRHHVWPKRFYVVEPGALYRSGRLEARPLQHVLDQYQIKTILTLLNDEPDDPDQQAEKRIAAEKGVAIVRIAMPGDGCGDFDALDKAADVLADPARRPVLVHCAAGVNRTGAVYAAYRMRYCGWDVDQALSEGDRYGCTIRDNSELVEHLKAYYRVRIAARDRTQSVATEPTSIPAELSTR